MLFTTSIRGILGDSISFPAAPPPNLMDEYWKLEPYEDDAESPLAFLEADIVDAAGKLFMAHSLTDTLINAEVLLPHEDSQAIAKVVRRMDDLEGKLIGEHNDNPLLNTLVYECVFDDGTTREYGCKHNCIKHLYGVQRGWFLELLFVPHNRSQEFRDGNKNGRQVHHYKDWYAASSPDHSWLEVPC